MKRCCFTQHLKVVLFCIDQIDVFCIDQIDVYDKVDKFCIDRIDVFSHCYGKLSNIANNSLALDRVK